MCGDDELLRLIARSRDYETDVLRERFHFHQVVLAVTPHEFGSTFNPYGAKVLPRLLRFDLLEIPCDGERLDGVAGCCVHAATGQEDGHLVMPVTMLCQDALKTTEHRSVVRDVADDSECFDNWHVGGTEGDQGMRVLIPWTRGKLTERKGYLGAGLRVGHFLKFSDDTRERGIAERDINCALPR